MKKILFSLFLFCLTLNAVTLNIAVAANVSYAIEELKVKFIELHPDIDINIILGSSGKLTAQISHGAPYGLFMSANMLYPSKLYESQLAITRPKVYAKGTLALFSAKKRDFSLGMKLLKTKDIQKIALANPKTAPYGKAAFETLQTSKIYTDIKTKLIFAESISQTLSYIITAADIGFIASSSLYSAKMSHYKKGTHWLELDPNLYSPIKQGVVLLSFGQDTQAYRLFYEFLFTIDAQKIFKKYGYII
ncbi:Molybdenum ABC transporter, periplasmic molybdenum-binding protein ModA (TC 3.A.1.8.1) [hydrothermal vent metagenome]|uniref:Molybdenum ABC transporter, periplasmic molybdenum-binding protein ModA (TC 3.A.1.8.1) n=1 Tax=hydrothermal vent metagenome TaxID=652676 RepID=A0A1W1BPG6_9ZZZZ